MARELKKLARLAKSVRRGELEERDVFYSIMKTVIESEEYQRGDLTEEDSEAIYRLFSGYYAHLRHVGFEGLPTTSPLKICAGCNEPIMESAGYVEHMRHGFAHVACLGNLNGEDCRSHCMRYVEAEKEVRA